MPFERMLWSQYGGALLAGIWITVEVSVVSMAIGMVVGLIFCFMRISRLPALRIVGDVFIQVTRNTPILVAVIWAYFVLPTLLHINFSPITASVIAIALQTAGYMAEVYRAGIESVESGQWEAAYSLGMTYWVVTRRVVIPQIPRLLIPPTLNVFVSTLTSTTVISIIAVPDLMYVSIKILNELFRPVEIYTTAAVIYLLLIYLVAAVAERMEQRYGYK